MERSMTERLILSIIILVASCAPASLQAQSCESLSKLVSPTVSITLAKVLDPGTFIPPGSRTPLLDLPGFCRVVATLKPTSDSVIQTEIWLPLSGWNGKFLAAPVLSVPIPRSHTTVGMAASMSPQTLRAEHNHDRFCQGFRMPLGA